MICPTCATENRPAAHFCHACGSPLPAERPAETTAPAVERAVTTAPTISTGRIRIAVGLATAQGIEQEINQDSLLALSLIPLTSGRSSPTLGLFAIADGMSQHLGETASRLAVQTLAQGVTLQVLMAELSDESCLEETLAVALTESVAEANARLYAAAQNSGHALVSTLAAVLLRDELAVVASVGDSRVYHGHDGRLQQVTTDHSVVQRLLETGQITAEEAATHPQRGVLYRSLGDRPQVEVDTFTLRLSPGDRLLLCCDGVWGVLSEEQLGEVLASFAGPQQASEEAVRRAMAAGTTDNASVLVIAVDDTAAQAVCQGQEWRKEYLDRLTPSGNRR